MGVLVVGSVALDTVETPCGKRKEILGGSATFFSYTCSYFAPVSLVGVVGDDFPPAYRRLLEERGVNLLGLQTRPGKTFRWGGAYRYDMNRAETKFTQLNVFEDFHPRVPPSLRDSAYVFLANIDPRLQLEVLACLKKPRLVIGDTMNHWIDLKKDKVLEVVKKLDVFILNDAEARQLTGEVSLRLAAKTILALGPAHVVIKKGEHGAALFSEKGVFCAPGLPLEKVVDPTGAGDTFAGGFVGHLAKAGKEDASVFRRAVIYGSVMASFNVEDFSLNRLKKLRRGDIEKRYREFIGLTRFS